MNLPRIGCVPVWSHNGYAYMINDAGQAFRRKLDLKNFIYDPWIPIDKSELPPEDQRSESTK